MVVNDRSQLESKREYCSAREVQGLARAKRWPSPEAALSSTNEGEFNA